MTFSCCRGGVGKPDTLLDGDIHARCHMELVAGSARINGAKKLPIEPIPRLEHGAHYTPAPSPVNGFRSFMYDNATWTFFLHLMIRLP